MNRLEDIFMKPENISQRELERYLNGECSTDEMYRIEKALQADPFLLESMEGLEQKGAMEGFEELQNRFHSKHGTGGHVPIWKKSTTWIIGLLGAAVIILSVMTFTDQGDIDRNTTGEIADNEQLSEPVEPEKFETTSISQPPLEDELKEIEEANMIDEKEVITYERTLANQPTTVEEKEVPEPMTALDSAMMQDAQSMQTINTPEAQLPEDELVEKSNVKILYFHDLKVVDYSAFYAKNIKFRNKDIPTGTNVQYSGKVENYDPMRGPYTIIPYREFIEIAMGKFNRNKFKEALKDYKVVIDHFPEDINAHFYGALCYYNLGKWEKATHYFQSVIANPIYTFDQEAEFYLAKTYAQAGEKEKARALFQEIRDEGKFYSSRAKKELKKL